MPDWKSFEITIPGKDILEPVRNVLETLLVFLEVLKAILNTIKAFLIDFGNPIRALVEALIALIEELFMALKVSGFFAYYDVPDLSIDPNFTRQAGGFPSWVTRFKSSLYDLKDFNRPQPREGSTQSGFLLLVVDASDPLEMIRRIIQLYRFFGKELDKTLYEAPDNFKVVPVGQSGDPLLAVASVFTDGPIESIEVSWTLPTTQETPDPGFSDVFMKMASEFIPPNFIIEKSVDVHPASRKVQLSDMGNADATGLVEYDQPVNVDPSIASRFATRVDNKVVNRLPLREISGEPLVKFQKYIVPGTGTDILGQLGRFRYIDNDVEVGKTYFYRVRAYSGDLALSGTNLSNPATKFEQLVSGVANGSSARTFNFPGTDVLMGKPTAIIQTTIPTTSDFDPLENARAVFLTAFSLDFHNEFPKGAEIGPDGVPTNPTIIGWGSLANQAGILAAFRSLDTLTDIGNSIADAENAELSFGKPDPPWVKFNVRRQAARLADAVVMALLQLPADLTDTFRSIMRGSLPAGPFDTKYKLEGKNTLEEVVFAYTETIPEPDNAGDVIADNTGFGEVPNLFGGKVDEAGIQTYVDSYDDAGLRKNILAVIRFFQSFTLGGVPVDWISIQPLRDIIPWSGQFLYDLLDKIDALLAAFNSIIDEIKAFIDMLIRKIEALEAFIQFLIDILDFIEDIQLSVSLLNVTGLSGGPGAWVDAIDTATGDVPQSGPDGYAAGIALAYVAPDITAFTTAFSIIFGG